MRAMELRGMVRSRRFNVTLVLTMGGEPLLDLVERDFRTRRVNQTGISDLTYVRKSVSREQMQIGHPHVPV